MSKDLLERLTALHKAATPAPWFERPLNDDLCMSGVGVATEADPYIDEHGYIDLDWPTEKLVAVCLLQEPRLVNVADKRWQQNADLIAAMRNALPELLRLARLGLERHP